VVYFAAAVWLAVYCYHSVDETADSYGSGSPTVIQAWQTCLLKEPASRHPIV